MIEIKKVSQQETSINPPKGDFEHMNNKKLSIDSDNISRSENFSINNSYDNSNILMKKKIENGKSKFNRNPKQLSIKIQKNEDIDVFGKRDILEEEINSKYEILKKILENTYFDILINIFTFYALFADDLRILLLPKSVDNFFNGLTLFCMILFIVEIIFSILTKKDYLFTFFFWLDLLSTLTLILDLSWISELFASSNK